MTVEQSRQAVGIRELARGLGALSDFFSGDVKAIGSYFVWNGQVAKFSDH